MHSKVRLEDTVIAAAQAKWNLTRPQWRDQGSADPTSRSKQKQKRTATYRGTRDATDSRRSCFPATRKTLKPLDDHRLANWRLLHLRPSADRPPHLGLRRNNVLHSPESHGISFSKGLWTCQGPPRATHLGRNRFSLSALGHSLQREHFADGFSGLAPLVPARRQRRYFVEVHVRADHHPRHREGAATRPERPRRPGRSGCRAWVKLQKQYGALRWRQHDPGAHFRSGRRSGRRRGRAVALYATSTTSLRPPIARAPARRSLLAGGRARGRSEDLARRGAGSRQIGA
jgi:hypothetical protein